MYRRPGTGGVRKLLLRVQSAGQQARFRAKMFPPISWPPRASSLLASSSRHKDNNTCLTSDMANNNTTNNASPLLNGKDLAGKWAEQDGTGLATTGGSRHCKQKQRDVCNDDDNLGVILCGVRNPSNVGSMMRTCSCFRVSRLLHLHYAANNKTNQKYWSEPHVSAALQSCSVGTFTRFEHDGMLFKSIPVNEFTLPERPLVVLEAIAGAVSIMEYKFPEQCEIMVGSEHKGVATEILRNLRKEVDAVVYVPMVGPHHSLNVASAMTIALYEYRRQWPGKGGRGGGS